MTLFTGSSRVADKLADDLNGRIKLEDAGFDWKILGPDVHEVHKFQSIEVAKGQVGTLGNVLKRAGLVWLTHNHHLLFFTIDF